MNCYKSYFLIILLLLLCMEAFAQRHAIYSPRIASLQVIAGNDNRQLPIVELGNESLTISFDDMTHDYHRYVYQVEHCEADWSKTESLFSNDYLQGFNAGEQRIEDTDQSLNTNHLYTHYSFRFPNEDCRITMSGNYRLTVYDADEENVPALSVCFMVVEPQMNIAMEVTSNTDKGVNSCYQQVGMRLDYGNIRVTDSRRQLKTVVLQNGRWDQAVWNPRANMERAGGLQWLHNRDLIFDAGNVYRKFEVLDLNHPTMGIEDIVWDGEEYQVYRFADEPRYSYVYDEAPQGAFYIRNSDNIDNEFSCDYAWVHFILKTERQNSDVYLNGAWTQDSFLPQYRMEYNETKHCYEKAVLLKQGYYSYQYVLLQEDGTTRLVPSEGNFFETANTYQVLVYYRGVGDRTDRLVGYSTCNFVTPSI